MKKKNMIAILSLMIIALTGCASTVDSNSKEIENLKISFVPSAPSEEIMNATEPLETLIQDEMTNFGYTIDKVTIDVGTSYEAVGESLASGTTDIGFIPGGTYILYEDEGVEAILTATRKGLSKTFDTPNKWNDNKATTYSDEFVDFYRSLIVAGPSDKGVELSDKINSGEELTFEDINSANICLQSPSSSAGYLYPAKNLLTKYDKKIGDLSSTVTTQGYGDALGRLAAGQCDITPIYADARMDYQEDWTTTYGREKSIWEETNVIGVTEPIMNDTISIAQESPIYSEEFVSDFQEAMMNIAKTEAGKKVISIYSHEGYVITNPSDYDLEREVQDSIINA